MVNLRVVNKKGIEKTHNLHAIPEAFLCHSPLFELKILFFLKKSIQDVKKPVEHGFQANTCSCAEQTLH
jgi:hypothetical protein